MDIGSGDGLMPLGNKPLPEPMLTQIYVTISSHNELTHWSRVAHICVSKVTIIGSDNDLSPGRRQAIIWTNAGILLIRPLGTNFNEMLIEILAFSFMKMRLKESSAKWHPFSLGLNVLKPVLSTATHMYSMVPQNVCVMDPSWMDSLQRPKSVSFTWPEEKKVK